VEGKTGYGTAFAYTPSAVGQLTADVTIKDSLASTFTKSLTLTVYAALAAAPTAKPSAPTTGAMVQFYAEESGGTGQDQFGWEFGDGHGSVLESPTHTYSTAGTYTVQLWVNDTGGGAVHQSITVSVSAAPSSAPGGSLAGVPLWEWGAIVAIVVVIAAAALLALRRRGRGSAPSSVPPPPPTGNAPPPPPPTPPPGAGGPPPGAT